MLKNIFKNIFGKKHTITDGKTENPNLLNCIGCGICVKSCPTNAIQIFKQRDIICTYCGACADICPNNAIYLNRYTIDVKKCTQCGYCSLVCAIPIIQQEIPIPKTPIIKKGCNKCCLCVPKCPNKAIYIENNEIKIDNNKCENCLLCVEFCPLNEIISPNEYIKNCIIKVDIDSCIFCKECEYVCPIK